MGAYEDPSKIIDDKSIALEAQGMQGFAQGIAQGISSYGKAIGRADEKKAKLAKAARLKDEKNSLEIGKDVANIGETWQNADNNATNGTLTTVLSQAGTAGITDQNGKPIQSVVDAMKNTDQNSRDQVIAWDVLMKSLGDKITNIDDITALMDDCKECDRSLGNPYADQLLNGKNVTSTPSITYNSETKKYEVGMSYSSDTIGAINSVMGKKGNEYKINLTNYGKESTNDNIIGLPGEGYFTVRPSDVTTSTNQQIVEQGIVGKKGIDPSFLTSSQGVRSFDRANIGQSDAYVNLSYVDLAKKGNDGSTLVDKIIGITNVEAEVELGMEMGNLPITAMYNKMVKNGALTQKVVDGRAKNYLTVPGYYDEKLKKNVPYLGANARDKNGDLMGGTIDIEIPSINAGEDGDNTVLIGDNYFNKDGVEGLKTVLKYQALNEIGAFEAPVVSTEANKNWVTGIDDKPSELNFNVQRTFTDITSDPNTAAGSAGYTIDTDQKGRMRLVDKAIGEGEITSSDVYDSKGTLTKAKNATQYFDFTNQETGKGDYIDFNMTLLNENKFLPNTSAETTGLKNEYRALLEAKWDKDFKGNVTSTSTPFVPSPERPPLTQITNR